MKSVLSFLCVVITAMPVFAKDLGYCAVKAGTESCDSLYGDLMPDGENQLGCSESGVCDTYSIGIPCQGWSVLVDRLSSLTNAQWNHGYDKLSAAEGNGFVSGDSVAHECFVQYACEVQCDWDIGLQEWKCVRSLDTATTYSVWEGILTETPCTGEPPL